VDTPPFFAVGQTPLVHCYIGSFGRKNDQPDLEISFVILENGKPTTTDPFKQVIDKKLDPKQDFVEIWFPVDANRAGSFVIKMTAKDRIANKSSDVEFPITVQELK
jgi:hypothetical protein